MASMIMGKGGYNRTYSPAIRQAKFYRLQQASAVALQLQEVNFGTLPYLWLPKSTRGLGARIHDMDSDCLLIILTNVVSSRMRRAPTKNEAPRIIRSPIKATFKMDHKLQKLKCENQIRDWLRKITTLTNAALIQLNRMQKCCIL